MSQVIFVLEDDSDIRRLVQYQLEGAGYSVRAYPAVDSGFLYVRNDNTLVCLDLRR